MLHAIEEGNMKAMYLVGEDMALVDSNANHVHDILSSLDFFVVQDIFLSRTAQYADVILPAVPSLEKTEHLQTQSVVCKDCIRRFRHSAMQNPTGGLFRKSPIV